MAPTAFRWTVFPIVMGATVAWTMARMAAGQPPAAAFILPQITAFAIVAILEHVYPLHRSWNRNRRDVHVDAVHGVTIAVLVGIASP
nr:hypothetical protein [Pseudomonadota bacterium]